MLMIGETLVKTPRQLTKVLKPILGPTYTVKRDVFLFVEGGDLDEAKRIILSLGLEVNDCRDVGANYLMVFMDGN